MLLAANQELFSKTVFCVPAHTDHPVSRGLRALPTLISERRGPSHGCPERGYVMKCFGRPGGQWLDWLCSNEGPLYLRIFSDGTAVFWTVPVVECILGLNGPNIFVVSQ